MHDTKLTIRISRDLLDNAKDFAKQNDTTLTKLIEAYLRRIPVSHHLKNAPIVSRLSGILPQDVSLDDYNKHLDEKYG